MSNFIPKHIHSHSYVYKILFGHYFQVYKNIFIRTFVTIPTQIKTNLHNRHYTFQLLLKII